MKNGFTLFLMFFFLVFPFVGFSQGEWNNWYFGVQAGMNFSSGSPQAITTSAMGITGGATSTSVSDSAGNLLFYSDGVTVWNANNSIMANGHGLLGGYAGAVQPVFAVQTLSNKDQYYIFTVGNQPYAPNQPITGLHYSQIDMTLNGGLGGIVVGMKNIVVPGGDSAVSQLMATRHRNNRDVWLLVLHHGIVKKYYAYLITAAGISSNPVISNTGLPQKCYSNPGVLKVSPDGSILACIDSVTEICNFNNATGIVTSRFLFLASPDPQISAHGMDFSLDSKLLYIVTNIPGSVSKNNLLIQYDVTKPDSVQFVGTRVIIDHACGHVQMGPDWKLYVNYYKGLVDTVSRVNNPSASGAACNFQMYAVGLLGHDNNATLPQFLQRYYLYINHTGSCLLDSIHFTSTVWPPVDSIHWWFGDPASGINNESWLPDPLHHFGIPGSYTVTVFVRHNDNRTDTSRQTITIYSNPQPNIGADQTICTGDSVTFDAGACMGCSYVWKDLGSGLTIGTSQTYKTGQAGTYAVIVTNSNNCIGSDTIQLQTTMVPLVTNNPLSKSICSGESTNIPLTSNVSGTIFHWTASLTLGNITGYSPDSGLVINQVLVNSLATPGIVTYHITPKVGSCSGAPVDFPVTVNAGDSVKVSITASNNNICSGTAVTFTAIPTNSGTTPSYQWKVNGVNVGTNNPLYSYSPNNGDVVKCNLTSNILCPSGNPATSNTVTMTVNSNHPVSVSISSSANPFCQGSSVTFTATPTNGGTSPSYQWKVTGINIGPNNPVYTYNPSPGDLVSCILTSNIACPTGNPATSNSITMIQNNNVLAGVSIVASTNPFCPGNSVTFNATPANGGTNPSYQWKVNGVNAGINSSTFVYSPVNGDSISCRMTSNLACVSDNPAVSNKIIMSGTLASVVTFTACFDTITTTNAQPIKLKGGIPLGGTYSGAGVTNGIFYPAIAGVGTHIINYTYTNAALCSVTDHRSLITINPAPFTCGNPITDPRDNKTYPTVHIGSQCWMAANLNYGSNIASSQDQRDNCQPQHYCYNDNLANCNTNGGLYQWDELMQYNDTPGLQGLCPPGWHIPTEADWNTLFANYISNAFAASPLLSTGFSGFNALLSGTRHINKSWDFQGFATFFWSSTAHGINKAGAHGMNDVDPSVSAYPAFRSNAFSVRCLHD